MYIRWQIAQSGELLACDDKARYSTYYEKLSCLVLFQNKWCHSTHLTLNNRSDGSCVYHTAAVRVIRKDTSGALTQPYQSFYQSSVSRHHTDLEAGTIFLSTVCWGDTLSGFAAAAPESPNVRPAHFGLFCSDIICELGGYFGSLGHCLLL